MNLTCDPKPIYILLTMNRTFIRVTLLLILGFFTISAPAQIGSSGPKVGDLAPPIILPNGSGKLVSLSDYASRGYVVLIFYRGYWCGACTLQLAGFSEEYEKFKSAGADIIAISNDSQAFAWSTSLATGSKFEVLSDSDNSAIETYGILNKGEKGPFANPAVFIIDRENRIRFKRVELGQPEGLHATEILPELKKLVAAK